MDVFRVVFKKKGGDVREMKFIEVKDLPAGVYTYKGMTRSTAGDPSLKLVWDVEKYSFRLINLNDIVEEITKIDDLSFDEIVKKYKQVK